MKNIRKKLIVILAFGLVLSISTPVFATESGEQNESTTETAPPTETTPKNNSVEEQKSKKELLKASANAVVGKTNLSFKIGDTPTAQDFVTVNDASNNPTFIFKNGQPVTNAPGNYSTEIHVTFNDNTSTDITVNYIVKEDAPLATLKTTTPVIELASKPTPNQFATPAAGAKLSFKSGAPSTKKTGTFTTTIVATKDGKTSELIVTYKVLDQEPPKISVNPDDYPFVVKGETITPSTFVTATDNSGKVTLTFKPGYEPTYTRLGMHTFVVIATDPSGNTTEFSSYYVIVSDKPTLKAPTLDLKRSTPSILYGVTLPNLGVIAEDEDENLIGWSIEDEKGNFTITFETPLQPGDIFALYSSTEVEYSEKTYYIYDPETLKIRELYESPSEVKTINTKNSNTNSTKKIIPKTGDANSIPLTLIGLILAGSSVIFLRKK
ncbi:LPXTG cell wall anchor domain-containing protein [Listeria innocua]|uniref:LPXTG cell wall anchor domain-containing protein n=1 Tax=Listeria innocua TaxID=1642 RepID=UPI0010B9B8D8|nr:LPXTG cell wall anchor domain-containing protein [Listeria innocua]EAD5685689.1 LPXTG cell wall anchor domain-containing protein [Listeria innocua]EAE2481687.1 LPXTG cell wall anchor domain-containing protein [Listeria innocua]EAF5009000.1 LPXTG cell wall anchor domain-containing protein [Listeria innocua]EAH4448491.1 LPXTG cell wall anchor domain-containing protein [Listeria innocua]EDO1152853.1 LPXTG cell wall anchor domain-containing protein [Listeria innocua]